MLILSAWNYHIPLLFILYAYLFTLYGVVRQICFARNPKCEECFLTGYCVEYGKKQKKGGKG